MASGKLCFIFCIAISCISVGSAEGLPTVFLDLVADDIPLGRLIIELRSDVVPKTAENFRVLCTGEKGYSYKGTNFDRVVPGFAAQGGEINGVQSIYGDKFEDENFTLKHAARGTVSMANNGANSNGSKFNITFIKASFLDNKSVVFGSIISGLDILGKMEALGSQGGKPARKIIIHNCGQLS